MLVGTNPIAFFKAIGSNFAFFYGFGSEPQKKYKKEFSYDEPIFRQPNFVMKPLDFVEEGVDLNFRISSRHAHKESHIFCVKRVHRKDTKG